MDLVIIKHYVKRLINFAKHPFRKPKTLVFEGYEIEFPNIRMNYSIDNINHSIEIHYLDYQQEHFDELTKDQWDILIGNAGMIAAPTLLNLDKIHHIHCEFLNFSPSTCQFYEDYLSGELGEYRLIYGINPKLRIRVSGNQSLPIKKLPPRTMKEKILVLNGGGKDSVVMSELISKMGIEQAWFTNQINAVRRNVINLSASQESYGLDLTISQNTPPIYTKEYLLPVGAFSAALGLVTAYIHNIPYITMGNEYSANDGNIVFNGFPINHQYNKSYEFEEKFCAHIKENISDQLHFFSFLRPLYEMRIVSIFANHKKYFDAFVSCNRYIKRGEWCKECEKCAFIYLALFPFVSREELIRIFGEDILLKPIIRKHILSMTQDKIKPWECVGVKEECQMALALMLKKDISLEFNEFPFRADFEKACEDIDLPSAEEKFLKSFNEPHGIPVKWLPQYQKYIQ